MPPSLSLVTEYWYKKPAVVQWKYCQLAQCGGQAVAQVFLGAALRWLHPRSSPMVHRVILGSGCYKQPVFL
jgi:hypothetical protein